MTCLFMIRMHTNQFIQAEKMARCGISDLGRRRIYYLCRAIKGLILFSRFVPLFIHIYVKSWNSIGFAYCSIIYSLRHVLIKKIMLSFNNYFQ